MIARHSMEQRNTYFDANELKWENPKPLMTDSPARWERVKKALMDNPNQWALVAENNHGMKLVAPNIRKYLGDEFEIVCRQSGKHRTAHARYVGTLNEEA